DRADRLDRRIEPARDLPVGGLELPRSRHRRIELGRETRAVGVEGVDLGRQRGVTAILVNATLDRRLERLERDLQASGRRVDLAGFRHSDLAPPLLLHYGQ